MPDLSEEPEAFDKLIRVLEDALENAAKILGPNVKPFFRSHHTVEHALQIYEDLSDLFDATRTGRAKLLERQPT